MTHTLKLRNLTLRINFLSNYSNFQALDKQFTRDHCVVLPLLHHWKLNRFNNNIKLRFSSSVQMF